MQAAEILALVQAGESLKTEFKADAKKQLEDGELLKNVVCLANAEGGTLLIGVEDDGRITGLNSGRKPFQRDPAAVQTHIFHNTRPPINTTVTLEHVAGEQVLAIEVLKHPAICATESGGCWRRVMGHRGPECRPFYPIEHPTHRIRLGLQDLTAMAPAGASWEDLDPLEFERLRRTIRTAGGDPRLLAHSDEDLAKALKLVQSDEDGTLIPVIAGLLLLGRDEALQRLVPTHGTVFQAFGPDSSLTVNEALPGTLIHQVEDLEARYEARKNEQEVLLGMIRLVVPEFARDSYREGVANALIHRDYSQLGKVHVQWWPDHLRIASPGGFPLGITQENILTHEPKPRNPRLAEACTRIGLVESAARGVDRIYLGQLRYGRPLPDYTATDETAVRLILWGGGTSLDFTRRIHELESQGSRMSLDELIVLHHLYEVRRCAPDELQRLMQKSEHQARRVIEGLVEKGLIERQGARKPLFHLSAAFYRTLGQPAQYVRIHGLDPLRQEAMVLEYAAAHGRVTRAEVAELCMLDEPQAKALLKRMLATRKLVLHGERRGAHYVLAPQAHDPSLVPLRGEVLKSEIRRLLDEAGGPLALPQIDDGLAARGFEVGGENKRNYLTGLLSRDKVTFKSFGRGRYGLAET